MKKKIITSVINYFPLKEMLSEKYGEPSDYLRKRMRLVRFDTCKYYTTYETEKGTIQLSIEHDRIKGFFVQLTFLEKENIQDETNRKMLKDGLVANLV